MESWENFQVHTSNYEAQTLQDKLPDFSEIIEKILGWENVSSDENTLQFSDAQYPNDISWKIRYEALTSIWYRAKDGSIRYITRKRPNQEKSNTPGAEDSGTIFHGIDNWKVISPRRFIADSTGKMRDDEISSEKVAQFFKWNMDIYLKDMSSWHLDTSYLPVEISHEKKGYLHLV